MPPSKVSTAGSTPMTAGSRLWPMICPVTNPSNENENRTSSRSRKSLRARRKVRMKSAPSKLRTPLTTRAVANAAMTCG
jgi:hypothetical protein